MALRAHYPDWQARALEILAHLEVAVRFKECKEADLRLAMNAFDDEIVAHVLVTIENVARCLAYEDNVDELLRSIAVLCEKRVVLHIHISDDALDPS